MIVDRSSQEITHAHIRDLPELLAPADCLVLNDTRVVPARLLGRRKMTGGRWEGLFLSADEDGFWQIICKTRGKLNSGDAITLIDRQSGDDIELWLLDKKPGGIWTAVPKSDESVWDILGMHWPCAPAQLHSPWRDGRRRPRTISDCLRPQSGLRCRADGRLALHHRVA